MAGNDDDIESMIAGGGFTGRMVGGQQAMPPMNPGKVAKGLAECFAAYATRHEFQPGQVVRQKLGVMARPRATHPEPFIFLHYLDEKEKTSIFSPMFVRIDCVVGKLDQEGDMTTMVAEALRFEPYPEDDMERASAEANRAIN